MKFGENFVFFFLQSGPNGGNYRRALRQRNHFTLHYFFDGAGDLDDEFLGLAARLDLRVARRLLEHKLGRFAVDPTSYFFENAQIIFLSVQQTLVY